MIIFSISCRHIPWYEHRSEIMILISNCRSPFHSSFRATVRRPFFQAGCSDGTWSRLFQCTGSVGWRGTYLDRYCKFSEFVCHQITNGSTFRRLKSVTCAQLQKSRVTYKSAEHVRDRRTNQHESQRGCACSRRRSARRADGTNLIEEAPWGGSYPTSASCRCHLGWRLPIQHSLSQGQSRSDGCKATDLFQTHNCLHRASTGDVSVISTKTERDVAGGR